MSTGGGRALTATLSELLCTEIPKQGFRKTVTRPEGGMDPGGVFFSGATGVLIRCSPDDGSGFPEDAPKQDTIQEEKCCPVETLVLRSRFVHTGSPVVRQALRSPDPEGWVSVPWVTQHPERRPGRDVHAP